QRALRVRFGLLRVSAGFIHFVRMFGLHSSPLYDDQYRLFKHHRVLPTRRSSDLPPGQPRTVWRTSTSPPSCTAASRSPLCGPPRSEEHTSELQSRENLVCRLLLEKKKPVRPQCFEFPSSMSARQRRFDPSQSSAW